MPLSGPELVDALFVTVATRLKPISLRDGAAVARYLNHLAYEMQPGIKRQEVLRLSEDLWAYVLQRSRFRTAAKAEVLRLLETLAPAQLVAYDSRSLLESVRNAPEPRPFTPAPMLVSPLNAAITADERLSNDLTEQIYAAYWALRLEKVGNARGKVADALNRAKVARKGRYDYDPWCSSDVGARLKQYEDTISKEPGKKQEHRRWLVQKWQRLCGG